MEHLLPLGIRDWPKALSTPLIQLSTYFKELFSKTLKVKELEKMDKQIAIILCELEKIFQPYFFVIMIHLSVHLAKEAMIAGPVHYQWMYPIERYLCKLKGYVRNKGHPERSIAEGYLLEECLTFCSRYMEDIETQFNKEDRVHDCDDDVDSVDRLPIFKTSGRAVGKVTTRSLTTQEWEEVHFYVLNNCEEMKSFIDSEYEREVPNTTKMTISRKRKFIQWFKDQVTSLSKEIHPSITSHIQALADGPDRAVASVNCYMVNGSMFHTRDNETERETQNSGIVVVGENALDYYGLLREIIEVQYTGGNRVTLFKCDWWDVHSHGRGITTDCFDFISVNTGKVLSNDPYVLASQVGQVYYVEDVAKPNWKVIVRANPRNYYDVPKKFVQDGFGDAVEVI